MVPCFSPKGQNLVQFVFLPFMKRLSHEFSYAFVDISRPRWSRWFLDFRQRDSLLTSVQFVFLPFLQRLSHEFSYAFVDIQQVDLDGLELVSSLVQFVFLPFLKGHCHEIFCFLFFMNQFPPSPRLSHQDRFEFFRKFAEIFARQGAPPVSTTPVAHLPPVSLPPVSTTPAANFATIFPSVIDTGGKFATGVNDTGGK